MTQRGEATRARLIEATRSVVREVGYAHASTRAIAQAAGVAEGTIYRHFPDKASLFFATVLESNAPIVAWVTTLPARAGEGTVEENLTDAAVALAGLRDQILPLELAIAADPELAAQRRQAMAAAGSSLASARTSTREMPPASSSECCSRWPECRGSATRASAPTASPRRCGSWSAESGRRGPSADRHDRRRSRHRPTSGEPARRSRSPRPGRP